MANVAFAIALEAIYQEYRRSWGNAPNGRGVVRRTTFARYHMAKARYDMWWDIEKLMTC